MLSVKEAYELVIANHEGFVEDTVIEGKDFYWFCIEYYPEGSFANPEELKVNKRTGKIERSTYMMGIVTRDFFYDDREDPPLHSIKEVLAGHV